MERRSLKFPRLNLPRSGVLELQVIATYDADERRGELLQDKFEVESEEQPQFAMFGITRYVTRDEARTVHGVHAAFARHPSFPDDIDVVILYQQSSPGDSPIKPFGTRQDEFLGILQEMGEPRKAQVNATIDLGDRDPDELWFPLPVSLAGHSPDATFDIRGVRGAKIGVEDSEPEYTFTLDRTNDEHVTLSAEWKLQGLLTPEALRSTLARAESIARDFVSGS